MVERIPKVETDPLRLVRKDDAGEEREGHGQQEQNEEHEERDDFSQNMDFKKWTGRDQAGSAHHPSLWERKPETLKSERAPTTEDESTERVSTRNLQEDEPTVSQSLSFFRATGLRNMRGEPRWATIGLYALALLGFVITAIFVLNALL